jgi:hypothetical protein
MYLRSCLLLLTAFDTPFVSTACTQTCR